jgi:hypothetical protein
VNEHELVNQDANDHNDRLKQQSLGVALVADVLFVKQEHIYLGLNRN